MAIELTTATTEQLSGIRQSLGFPTMTDIFPNAKFILGFGGIQIDNNRFGSIVNFKNCNIVGLVILNNYTNDYKIETIQNAQDLTSIEDAGTNAALTLNNNSLSEATINQLFTDLPTTTKTATINVASNPGAATCDTTIAQNKGYIVVTE
jgi:hypothetical protein